MMRTFTPFTDVRLNAEVLDEATLASQCNQAVAILKTLLGRDKGWGWHPGVIMWHGHEDLLAEQAFAYVKVWERMHPPVPKGSPGTFVPELNRCGFARGHVAKEKPWWWGHEMFHDSNKSALLRIDPEWYGSFFPGVNNNICEWWPHTREPGKFKFGPQPAPDMPNGRQFDYVVDGKPVYKDAAKMPPLEFAQHANMFHNLMPDIRTGVSANISDEMRAILNALHDRFHRLRVYTTHDHA